MLSSIHRTEGPRATRSTPCVKNIDCEGVNMLVLDIPRRCPSGFSYIDVPLYHRVHLNLAAGRTLHGCILACANNPRLPELIISPFEFDRWDKIWRLNMTITDRPGIFHEVCDVLTRNGAHVLAAESSTTQQQSLYQLELVVDLEDETRLQWIRLSLLARFLKEVTFRQDGSPRLRIQRLHGLWHAKRDFETQRAKPLGFPPQKIEVRIKWAEKSPHQVLRVVVPTKVRDLLKKTVRAAFERRHNDGFCLRLSDTKNRFLRVLYFRADEPVLHARIEYSNQPGATTTITEALKENHFNILTAYYASSGSGERCRMELLMRCDAATGMRTAQRKALLESALSNAVGAADLQIAVGYPRNYAKSWERKGVKTLPKIRLNKELSEPEWFENLHRGLEAQFLDLKSKADRGVDNPSDVARWKLARQLVEKYRELIEQPTEQRKILFVSCHYAGDQMDMIRAKAEAKGFMVISGNDLLSSDNLRSGLLKAIYSCTHFLGVWSREGAQEFENRYWPSPWLLWEFGVADAFSLTWRLLISHAIEDAAWKRIAPERQHEFFAMNFESKLDRVLDVLASLPGKRPPFIDIREIA